MPSFFVGATKANRQPPVPGLLPITFLGWGVKQGWYCQRFQCVLFGQCLVMTTANRTSRPTLPLSPPFPSACPP